MSGGTDAEAAGVDEAMGALQSWGRAFGEFGRQFGSQAGMHVTDSDALIQIISAEDRGALLTPSELSRRIGLTTGATSSLLNRLEEAGHIERIRERTDRRVVKLRSTPEVHRRVDEFFADLGTDLEAGMAHYPPQLLLQFAGMVSELTAIMDRHLALRLVKR
ncbi:MarR family winged helix-turn-helix transcriptional regulator [Actinoplanes sp. NPDC051494]|uniref:MarR family winged helix-turn-helix transcriptional regulator n=1 Tax=Actinoplanes sp. NPDC051494 TaxID=3363907 RepID=UPI0037A0E3FB